MSDASSEDGRAASVILQLLASRSPRSICPSEAARALTGAGEAWRGQLAVVRRVALRLAGEGRLDILRKGKRITNLAEVKGGIRLRQPAAGGTEDDAPP